MKNRFGKIVLATVGLLFLSVAASAQQHTVTGTVTDAKTGRALIGANILVQGTTLGTATDTKGEYSISVPSLEDTLRVTFIGYTKKYVPIKGRTHINIKLVSVIAKGKHAVVVTAFGQKMAKQDVVGAVTSLSPHQLQMLQIAPTANLTTALAGRIPGLIAFQRSGAPGNNSAKFFVRGVTTFGYDAHPLILIDGVRSTVTDLAQLNPNDIAHFSILQDAAATALYGSKAANGVLIIKTKVGRKNTHLLTSIRVANTISMPTQVPKFASPIVYMEDADQATRTRNPLTSEPYSERKIDKTKAGANPYLYPAVRWRKKLFKNYTSDRRFDLNISGGGHIASYYVSGSFDRSNGLLKVPHINNFNNNIALNDYSLRSNINIDLTKRTAIALKINGIFRNYKGPLQGGNGVYEQIVRANPVRFPAAFPIDSTYAFAHHLLFGNYLGVGQSLMLNPFAQMVKGYKKKNTSTINAQIRIAENLSKLITKGLEFKVLANIQRYAFRSVVREYTPYFYQASATNVRNNSYVLTLLNPKKGDNHLSYEPQGETINALFQIRTSLTYSNTFGKGNNVNSFLVFKAHNKIYDNQSSLEASLPHRNVNLAGRVSYNYKHRYYIEGNFGLTASERFAKGHRYGFFPSFGVKYNISNEKFWQPIHHIVSTLSIRASYGFSGNDELSAPNHRFLYLSKVNFNSPGYTTGVTSGYTLSGISISQYPNPDITWERARKTNIGIQLGFFNNKLTINTNLYHQFRYNILQQRVNLTPAMGLLTNPRANYGQVKSHGLSSRLVFGQSFNKNWSLHIRGNFTFARNKIVKYSEDPFTNAPNRIRIGQPIDEAYGLYATHLFVDQEEVDNSPHQNFGEYGPGDIKYRDVNGDGEVTDDDLVPMGYPTVPEINYGFGFSLNYKGLVFSTFFEGLAHESFFIDANSSNSGVAPYVGGHEVLKAFAKNHWTVNNRNIQALYPRFSTMSVPIGESNNAQRSNWWLRNGSFLRIKEVQIGYNLPPALISHLGLRRLRIYINSRNLYHLVILNYGIQKWLVRVLGIRFSVLLILEC